MGMGKGKQKLLPPLLLTSHGKQSENQSFYNLLENRCQTTCIPVLNNKTVLGSAYGWLALVDRTESDCCLWNSTSMEIIQLQELDVEVCPYTSCIMSKPPTEPDCIIVFNKRFSKGQTVYRINSGDNNNAVFKVNPEEEGYQIVAMGSFQGQIHGLIEQDFEFQFATFHFDGDKLEAASWSLDGGLTCWEVPQPMPARIWSETNEHVLIESPCGTELLLVTKTFLEHYLEYSGVHFRVFRYDVIRMEFEELENLDGRTIFMAPYGNGFCCSSESFGSAIKSNSIYYTNSKGMVMYVYDMDDRSTITLQTSSDSDIDPHTSQSCWVNLPQTSGSSLQV